MKVKPSDDAEDQLTFNKDEYHHQDEASSSSISGSKVAFATAKREKNYLRMKVVNNTTASKPTRKSSETSSMISHAGGELMWDEMQEGFRQVQDQRNYKMSNFLLTFADPDLEEVYIENLFQIQRYGLRKALLVITICAVLLSGMLMTQGHPFIFIVICNIAGLLYFCVYLMTKRALFYRRWFELIMKGTAISTFAALYGIIYATKIKEPPICNAYVTSFFLTAVRPTFKSALIITLMNNVMQFCAYFMNGYVQEALLYSFVLCLISASALGLCYQLERSLKRKVVSEMKTKALINDLLHKRRIKAKILLSIYPAHFAKLFVGHTIESAPAKSGTATCIVVDISKKFDDFLRDEDVRKYLLSSRRMLIQYFKSAGVEIIKFDGMRCMGVHGLFESKSPDQGSNDVYSLARRILKSRKIAFRVGIARGLVLAGVVLDSRRIVDVFGKGPENAAINCDLTNSQQRIVLCEETRREFLSTVGANETYMKEVYGDVDSSMTFSMTEFFSTTEKINRNTQNPDQKLDLKDGRDDEEIDMILEQTSGADTAVTPSIQQQVRNHIQEKQVASGATRFYPLFGFIAVFMYGMLDAVFICQAGLLSFDNMVGIILITRMLVWTPVTLLCALAVLFVSIDSKIKNSQLWTQRSSVLFYSWYSLQILANFFVLHQSRWTEDMDPYHVIFLYMEFMLFLDYVVGSTMTSHRFFKYSFTVSFIPGLIAATLNTGITMNTMIIDKLVEYLALHTSGIVLYNIASKIKHQTKEDEITALEQELMQFNKIQEEISFLSDALHSIIPTALVDKAENNSLDTFSRHSGGYVACVNMLDVLDRFDADSEESKIKALSDLLIWMEGFASEFGVRVVKTFGTNVMLWSGPEQAQNEHASRTSVAMIELCISLQQALARYQSEGKEIDVDSYITISHGDIYVGVLGTYRMSLDVWGNAAAECKIMQQVGPVSKIAVSESAAKQLDHNPNYRLYPEGAYYSIEKVLDVWSLFSAECEWLDDSH